MSLKNLSLGLSKNYNGSFFYDGFQSVNQF